MEDPHRLSMDLHPASLYRPGREATLHQHGDMVREKFNLDIKFNIDRIGSRLPDKL